MDKTRCVVTGRRKYFICGLTAQILLSDFFVSPDFLCDEKVVEQEKRMKSIFLTLPRLFCDASYAQRVVQECQRSVGSYSIPSHSLSPLWLAT